MNTAIFVVSDYALTYESDSIRVNIHKGIVNTWINHRQITHSSNEAFGVLIGSISLDNKEVWINHLTEPYSEDKSSRSSFLLCDANHQKEVNKAFSRSNGAMGYIGTWHTHPELTPTPSIIDKKDWLNCLDRNKKRQLIFVIIGIEKTAIFHHKKEGILEQLIKKTENINNINL